VSVFLKTQTKLSQVSGSYLNPPLLGMTVNKNVLKNIGGEITDGILLNGDAQKIKVLLVARLPVPYYFIGRFLIFNFSCLTEPEDVRK
jgi:hypothetical protein